KLKIDKDSIKSLINELIEKNKLLKEKQETNYKYIDKFNKELEEVNNKIINNVNLNYIIKLMNDLDKRINIRNYKEIKSKIDKRFTERSEERRVGKENRTKR